MRVDPEVTLPLGVVKVKVGNLATGRAGLVEGQFLINWDDYEFGATLRGEHSVQVQPVSKLD